MVFRLKNYLCVKWSKIKMVVVIFIEGFYGLREYVGVEVEVFWYGFGVVARGVIGG